MELTVYRAQIAAQTAKLEPEGSHLPEREPAVNTRHRLRAIADMHGLTSSAAFMDVAQGEVSEVQPVVPTSVMCPSVYGNTAAERIMQLKRAKHGLDLDPRQGMKWSDLDGGH